MNLSTANVLFLDLQTTGAKPGLANILEIAWSSRNCPEIESHLVQQPEGSPIPSRISWLTGIGEEDMIQAQPLNEVLKHLNIYLQSHFKKEIFAIIHFAQFEKAFLWDAFERQQESLPFSILCTHEIAKRLLPNLPTRGIKGLAGYYGFPSGELKRASTHVHATQIIWQGLVSTLAEQGIHSLEQLHAWLQETPKPARVKYEYPLPKEVRLGLPKKPGVYRMLSKWDQVLYVGKATNLHERVNSYFRGQKNRDPRKLEMLTQVWNLKVTPLNSPLEAALLETDEIKRLDPPYNICLKTGRRSLFFFNRSFTSISEESSEEHCMGPFSNAMVLDSMLRLSHSLQTGEFDQNLFFDPLDSSLLKEGFEIFCDRHHLNPDSFCSVRAILALGLQWFRQMKKLPEIENEIFDESEGDSAVDEFEDSLEEVELTAPDIADKFERHFIRSAKAYLRAKKLSQLLNSDIHFEIKPQLQGFLKIRRGQIVNEEKEQNYSSTPWAHLSIETYDRMTVLFTELEKIRAQNKMISITRIRS